MRLIIALIPDRETIGFARRLNAAYVDFGSTLSLRETAEACNLPHLTLTHAPIDEAEALELKRRIVASLPARRQLPMADLTTITARFGEWIFWDAVPDMTFFDVLGWVLNAVNAVRGDRRVDATWTMTPIQQEAFERYGYPNTGQALEPHITLGLIPKEKMPEVIRTGDPRNHQATFTRMVIATAGPNGTLARILAEHQL